MLESMFLLILSLVILTASAQSPPTFHDLGDAHNLFEDYVQKHGKVYNPEEYLKRLDIFKQNLAQINERNARYQQNVLGINRFTDLTAEERRKYLGFKRFDAASHDRVIRRLEYPAEAITAPEQFDWRDHNAVTHVKDQLHCEASWVFSAVGNIEGQYAIKHKKLIAFSEQQGIDCTKISNCEGGWPDELMSNYQWYGYQDMNTYGMVSEAQYPYTGIPSPWNHYGVKACPAGLPDKKKYTRVIDYEIIVPKDEETLKQLLFETGPLAVGLDMSEIYEYSKGILDPMPFLCDGKADHSVLLVGYGLENGTKFWTLKNSWGEGWGEKGYFRLVRGKTACNMGVSYTATCTVL